MVLEELEGDLVEELLVLVVVALGGHIGHKAQVLQPYFLSDLFGGVLVAVGVEVVEEVLVGDAGLLKAHLLGPPFLHYVRGGSVDEEHRDGLEEGFGVVFHQLAHDLLRAQELDHIVHVGRQLLLRDLPPRELLPPQEQLHHPQNLVRQVLRRLLSLNVLLRPLIHLIERDDVVLGALDVLLAGLLVEVVQREQHLDARQIILGLEGLGQEEDAGRQELLLTEVDQLRDDVFGA
mmetsp:Transcript_35171/g.34197  ORF Transcript_35171/g.34197 Transcript_35171/m.34197 type:complete len:234 (-) Transcript_35171:218-919(-)